MFRKCQTHFMHFNSKLVCQPVNLQVSITLITHKSSPSEFRWLVTLYRSSSIQKSRIQHPGSRITSSPYTPSPPPESSHTFHARLFRWPSDPFPTPSTGLA